MKINVGTPESPVWEDVPARGALLRDTPGWQEGRFADLSATMDPGAAHVSIQSGPTRFWTPPRYQSFDAAGPDVQSSNLDATSKPSWPYPDFEDDPAYPSWCHRYGKFVEVHISCKTTRAMNYGSVSGNVGDQEICVLPPEYWPNGKNRHASGAQYGRGGIMFFIVFGTGVVKLFAVDGYGSTWSVPAGGTQVVTFRYLVD